MVGNSPGHRTHSPNPSRTTHQVREAIQAALSLLEPAERGRVLEQLLAEVQNGHSVSDVATQEHPSPSPFTIVYSGTLEYDGRAYLATQTVEGEASHAYIMLRRPLGREKSHLRSAWHFGAEICDLDAHRRFLECLLERESLQQLTSTELEILKTHRTSAVLNREGALMLIQDSTQPIAFIPADLGDFRGGIAIYRTPSPTTSLPTPQSDDLAFRFAVPEHNFSFSGILSRQIFSSREEAERYAHQIGGHLANQHEMGLFCRLVGGTNLPDELRLPSALAHADAVLFSKGTYYFLRPKYAQPSMVHGRMNHWSGRALIIQAVESTAEPHLDNGQATELPSVKPPTQTRFRFVNPEISKMDEATVNDPNS